MDNGKLIIGAVFFVIFIVMEIWYRNKQGKKTKELSAKEKPVKIFEYCKIFYTYDESSAKSQVLFSHPASVVPCDVLLFQDHIGLVAANGYGIHTNDVKIKDVNSVTIKKILWEKVLYVNYDEVSETGSVKNITFCLEGDLEDLSYIRNFIEERMTRPQVIDLTDGN